MENIAENIYRFVQYIETSAPCVRRVVSATPANKKHLYNINICTISAQRLRRWSNIVQMLYKCFVFAGTLSSRR